MTSTNLSQTIVVLGTGTMAVGIAAGFIEAGMPLVILGRTIEKAEVALADAKNWLSRWVRKSRLMDHIRPV